MPIKQDNVVMDKSKAFALRIVKLYKFLTTTAEVKEYVLSKQILRSGTSIGANIRESRRAQSSSDFIAKLYISLKEADETQYWLELLYGGEYITVKQYTSLNNDCEELLRLLTSIIKGTQQNTAEKIIHNSKFKIQN